jgi:hypothetical protein
MDLEIHQALKETLSQLHGVLSLLSNEQYSSPLKVLNNSSIGQHTRHIIEFFEVVIEGYSAGVVNYDNRKRKLSIEHDCEEALAQLLRIEKNVSREDKLLHLAGRYSSVSKNEILVASTYYREVIYNLEHMIHHMAIIKIAIQSSTAVTLPFEFGVAPATLRYQNTGS